MSCGVYTMPMPGKEIQKISVIGVILLLAAIITFVGLSYGSDESLTKIAKIVASIALAVFGVTGDSPE